MVEGFFNFHPRVCVKGMGTKIQVATGHKKNSARHCIRLRIQKRDRINKQTEIRVENKNFRKCLFKCYSSRNFSFSECSNSDL